jgi:sensor domain CHASE-containing protein/nitrogen-specific signal transduction histidine kinase
VKIRPKLIALMAGIFVILCLAETLVERRVVMPSFGALERADAGTAMRRINYALDLAVDRVAVVAADWGNWSDTYQFVQDHDIAFIKTNINNVAIKQLAVNVVLIVDVDGRFALASDLDLNTDRPLGLDLAAGDRLPADFPWRANLREGRPTRGLLRTNRGVLMLAGAPVLDGYGRGPCRGMVIMGRLLERSEIQRIAAQAQTDFALLDAAPGAAAERLESAAAVTRVYRSIDDVYGRPIGTLRVTVPREITMRGQVAVTYASTCLIAAAVIVLILLMIVLNRMILSPLAVVTRHAVAVGEDKDLTTRLDLQRADEIGVLAREFDRMVGRVAQSRTQLVDQSYQAGFAELAKGVLHNLGNAMTPISVRLANLAERLRAVPVEDAEQAVAELQQGSADPQRTADLQEFLRLACRELAHTVKSAREDVAVVTRQASVIQTALAEQMRSARNEHVIEPVRLTELVAQSLEIVPDSCRARLRIDTDDTVRRLGVVRLARTVLRLILQNLIINAADAVRDAGKERGVLRLSAEIVREADREQLHLQCNDDGVGIPAQHLERVFEKGFSTKSPETNHGIGLHWCANAINALGGRIWAASEGPGRGASLHLMIPLATPEPASLAGAA